MSHCAHAIILKKSEKGELSVLLVKEGKQWALPGGKKDGNETKEETLDRECFEEIKSHVNLLSRILKKPEFDNLGKFTHVRFVFLAEPLSEIKECPQIKFFPLNQLPRKLRKRSRQAIQKFIKTQAPN